MAKAHIADILKTGIANLPNWINIPLLRLNPLRESIYGPGYRKFKQSLPTIDPEQRLIEMANYAIANVPYYRTRYKGLAIKDIDQFKREIAFIDKKEVNAHWDDFIADGIDLGKTVLKTTSGTSSKPLRMIIPANRYVTEMVFTTGIWRRCGWNFDVRATIRGIEIPKGKTYKVNPVTREFIFDSTRLNQEYAAQVYYVMRRHHINTIYTYARVAIAFMQMCRDQGLDTSFIKYALLTSEPVTDAAYAFLTKGCGLSVSFTYGHTEKLIYAGNDGAQEYKVEELYGYTELIDENGKDITTPGGYGELVGTTLYNKYFPLIRYRTDDYAELSRITPTEYGYSQRWLGHIDGRHAYNIIIKHDGSRITETAILLDHSVCCRIDGLQYTQTKAGYITVDIIPGKDFTDKDTEYMRRQTAHVMDGEQYVQVNIVDHLTLMPNGKFTPVLNYILNPALSPDKKKEQDPSSILIS